MAEEQKKDENMELLSIEEAAAYLRFSTHIFTSLLVRMRFRI